MAAENVFRHLVDSHTLLQISVRTPLLLSPCPWGSWHVACCWGQVVWDVWGTDCAPPPLVTPPGLRCEQNCSSSSQLTWARLSIGAASLPGSPRVKNERSGCSVGFFGIMLLYPEEQVTW